MPGNDLGSRRRRDRGKRAVGIVVTKPKNRQIVNCQWHPRPRLPRLELSEYSDPTVKSSVFSSSNFRHLKKKLNKEE